MTAPERTYAVVVGIEQYEAGEAWDLDGAAASALRIIRWLCRCGVPVMNINVLLSPLDANRLTVQQTLAELGFAPEQSRPATADEIRRVITEQLPDKDGDLLVLFWSGHGVLDRQNQRRLFCANAAVYDKHNLNLSQLLAALSRKNFRGLRDQVVLIDACANFIQEMRLKLRESESGFGEGDTRTVNLDALLASGQGEKAKLDQKARSGTFARVVADWLDEHPATLPPAMNELAAAVTAHFDRLRQDNVTGQHPVRIREILHGTPDEYIERVYGGEPVPGNVWQSARSAGLTAGQLRKTAAAIAAIPQVATESRRDALFAALRDVTGPITPTDDLDADLLDLVSAVLDQQAPAELFQALLGLSASEEERIAALAVRHRWELQAAVGPLLGALAETPWRHITGALAQTVCDVPAGLSEADDVLEFLADLRRPAAAAPALAEYLVRLQRRWTRLEIPPGWFDEHGLDEAAVVALRTRVAAETRMRRKLVIDLRDSRPQEWQTAVTGYLGPHWCLQSVTCKPDADGVRNAVVKIVEWAKSQAADLAIGFLLGHDLLGELPEQWEYQDAVIPPIRLCEEHPVVLHIAERMTIPQLWPAYENKLDAIEASADGAQTVLWLDQDDLATIRRTVQASDDAYVAFTFAPQVRPDSRGTAVMAAVAAGAPCVVWVQVAPADGYDLRERLGQMLGPVNDFPANLRLRRAADRYMSDALRVIWDRRNELPDAIERLGEELVRNA